MALAKFKKIRVCGWKPRREDFMRGLQELGIVELLPAPGPGAPAAAGGTPADRYSMADYCLSVLGEFRKKGLSESFFPQRMAVTPEDYVSATEKFPLEEFYEKCRDREQKLKEMEAERAGRQAEYDRRAPWRRLKLSPADLRGTRRLKTEAVRIKRKALGGFADGIGDFGFVSEINSTKAFSFCVCGYLREEDARFHEELAAAGGETANLSAGGYPDNLAPAGVMDRIKDRLAEIETEKASLLEEKAKEARFIKELMILCEHFENLGRRRSAGENLQLTDTVFFFHGWIKEKDLPALHEFISGSFPGVLAETVAPGEDETPPSALENPPAVRPFEAVTGLYGMPRRGELDPTPFLAPFFAVFFAICMTDAGYGILMVLMSFLAGRKLKAAGNTARFINLLMLSGLATVAAGILTGSFFGLSPEQAPPGFGFVGAVRERFMLLDPMEDFLAFMLITLGLGFLQVWFGYLVRLLQEARSGSVFSALGTQLPWLLVLPGLLLLGISRNPETVLLGLAGGEVLGEGWDLAARVMLYAGLAGMFIRPGAGSFIKRAGGGLAGLYGIIGCLGDVLSYVRLFALGLATVAMAIAVNTMAGMASGLPVIGIIAGALIAAAGHTANMAINALSAFIHTVRLQFVEFFTRFYAGGGGSFRPFSLANRFVEIQNGGG